ncbi:MAG: PAC2 family protein, partial [Egibacteraceae bacterium]
MEVVGVEQRPPPLRRPVLLAAFRGWNDAGEAASGTVSALADSLGAERFAGIDAEEFFDFQATRPTVQLADSDRRIDWPVNRFSWAELPGSPHQAVLLDGTEPNLRWRTFADGVVGLAAELGVELV